MKKILSYSVSDVPSTPIGIILKNGIARFLPKTEDDLLCGIDSLDRLSILNDLKCCFAKEFEEKQLLNKELLVDILHVIPRQTLKKDLLYAYLYALYFLDRDTFTLREIKRTSHLIEADNMRIHNVKLWELHTYGALVIKKIPYANVDPVETARCISSLNSDSSEKPHLHKVILESFIQTTDAVVSLNCRVDRWMRLLDSPEFSDLNVLAYPGEYHGEPIDRSISIDLKINIALKACLSDFPLLPMQTSLLRKLLEKGFKQAWISELLFMNYAHIIDENKIDDMTSLSSDLDLVKTCKVENRLSVLVEFIIFQEKSISKYKDRDLMTYLNKELPDRAYIYDKDRSTLLNNHLKTTSDTQFNFSQLYCIEVGLRRLRDGNQDSAITWFSKAIELYQLHEKNVPIELVKTILSVFQEKKDALSSLYLLTSFPQFFELERERLMEMLEDQTRKNHGIEIDRNILRETRSYRLIQGSSFMVKELNVSGSWYTLKKLITPKVVLTTTFSSSSTSRMEVGYEEKFLKKEKQKTKGIPYKNGSEPDTKSISKSEEIKGVCVENNELSEFLRSLKNISSVDFKRSLSQLPGFLRFETGGRHPKLVVSGINGNPRRIPIPSGHNGINLGTAREVLKLVHNNAA